MKAGMIFITVTLCAVAVYVVARAISDTFVSGAVATMVIPGVQHLVMRAIS